MSLDQLISTQCGVLSSEQALEHVAKSSLQWLCSSKGRWQRPLPNVVVTHNGPLTDEQKQRAGVIYCGPRAALSGTSSATTQGLKGYADELVHVLVPHSNSTPSRQFVRVHRTRNPPDQTGDIHPAHQPRQVRLPRALIEIARAAKTLDDACGPLAAAVQQRLCTPVQLRSVLSRVGPVPRQALLHAAIDDMEVGAHSALELAFVRFVRRHQLPTPELQQVVTADGLRRLDATWPEYQVWVEVDGSAHRDNANWQADLERHNAISVTRNELCLLRFSSHLLRTRPDRCVAMLSAALSRGGWRPR